MVNQFFTKHNQIKEKKQNVKNEFEQSNVTESF